MTLFHCRSVTQTTSYLKHKKKTKEDVIASFVKVFKCSLLDFLILILIQATTTTKKERWNSLPSSKLYTNAKNVWNHFSTSVIVVVKHKARKLCESVLSMMKLERFSSEKKAHGNQCIRILNTSSNVCTFSDFFFSRKRKLSFHIHVKICIIFTIWINVMWCYHASLWYQNMYNSGKKGWQKITTIEFLFLGIFLTCLRSPFSHVQHKNTDI